MPSQSDETRGRTTCAIDVSPAVVDAEAELTLRGSVSCSPACDLRGHALLIKDQGGADLGRVELTEFDGAARATGELVVKAPAEPGGYTWLAVCPAVVKNGISYAEASTPISFTVTPHATSVVAWDIPSAIVAGERFRIKVGIKCSNECRLTNTDVGVYDHDGARMAAGTLPGDRWPGTTGLHVVEVELEAPAREGLYTWSAKGPSTMLGASPSTMLGASPGSDVGIPHAEGSISFGVRVVSQPECLVTVEAVDTVSHTPLSGARVTLHPYRAVTDERGVAEVRVAKGAYTLFVSQATYLTFRLPVEVTADMTARAELSLEPVPERN